MRRGFTLVELTMVMVLIGVLATVAAPRLLERNALDEHAAAQSLRGLLRASRAVAVAQERDVCVLVAAATVRAVYAGPLGCDPARPLAGAGGQPELRIAAPTGLAFGGDAVLRFGTRGQLVPAADRRVTLGTRQWIVERRTGGVL